MSAAIPETRFAIVGDGPLRGSLEGLSRELGIASRVAFFGEQTDIASYISTLDIAALVSEAEGCSNSILEAMALGKPVVATDVGGNRELVEQGKTGILVPLGDAETVANAILSLIREPETARMMGKLARDKVTTSFSVDTMVRQYETLYNATIQRNLNTRKGKSWSR